MYIISDWVAQLGDPDDASIPALRTGRGMTLLRARVACSTVPGAASIAGAASDLISDSSMFSDSLVDAVFAAKTVRQSGGD